MVLIALPLWYQSAWFDAPGRRWIGLMTHKPPTEDYVPVLPWFGVVLVGMAVGSYIVRVVPRYLSRFDEAHWVHWLALAGRHSLVIYLLHQPLLMALLYIIVRPDS